MASIDDSAMSDEVPEGRALRDRVVVLRVVAGGVFNEASFSTWSTTIPSLVVLLDNFSLEGGLETLSSVSLLPEELLVFWTRVDLTRVLESELEAVA